MKPIDHQIFQDIRKQENILQKASEEDLALYWRIRNDLQNTKEDRYKIRSLIWEEMERIYEGLSRKPIQLRFPYFHGFDGRRLIMLAREAIDKMEWPAYIEKDHPATVENSTG